MLLCFRVFSSRNSDNRYKYLKFPNKKYLITGGTSAGSCASGFGVCCIFTGNNIFCVLLKIFWPTFSGYCGGTTSSNNTYFKSSSTDTSPCQFSVCKVSKKKTFNLNIETFLLDHKWYLFHQTCVWVIFHWWTIYADSCRDFRSWKNPMSRFSI